ncbi:MAG: S-layer homology domain-containing protein [Oscillospiraceae bacterium]|nr:S-layer homology domain-containing protein [Oscillospiraceae bacterium]
MKKNTISKRIISAIISVALIFGFTFAPQNEEVQAADVVALATNHEELASLLNDTSVDIIEIDGELQLSDVIEIRKTRTVTLKSANEGQGAYIISAPGMRHLATVGATSVIKLTFIDVQLQGNRPDIGGGIDNGINGVISGAKLTLAGENTMPGFPNIYNCYREVGGVLLTVNSQSELNLCGNFKIANNRGDSYQGAAIYKLSGTLNIYDEVVISNNEANGYGGGVYNWRDDINMYNNALIYENSSAMGGGIKMASGTLNMYDNASILNNTASQTGGGVNFYNDSTAVINMYDDASVTGNKSRNGGGISNYIRFFGEINLYDSSKVTNNEATWDGGGIFTVSLDRVFADEGVIFAGNTARAPFFLTDQAGIDLHTVKILTPTRSYYVEPFTYAYNNYDINYVDANPPTPYPTIEPTEVPPTAEPTQMPTANPTTAPTSTPTANPTNLPTLIPTLLPTASPTLIPTSSPTSNPTGIPTLLPTSNPSAIPTAASTANPTLIPTVIPTIAPTENPTLMPTIEPTLKPTQEATPEPTIEPTLEPTETSTLLPTLEPTAEPTMKPESTPAPTAGPTERPPVTTPAPTAVPTPIDWGHTTSTPLPTLMPTPIGTTPNPSANPNGPTATPTPTRPPIIVDGVGTIGLSDLGDRYYNGKPHTPKPYITMNDGTVLIEGEDYTLDWDNNIEVGLAVCIVTFIGNHTGTSRIYFNILPVDLLIKDDHFAYMKGYDDGEFKPEANMNRAQAAVMFARLMKEQMDISFEAKGIFSDVPRDTWFAKEIEYLAGLGIITGYDGAYFNPTEAINRAEFAALASRFASLSTSNSVSFNDVPSNYWAHDAIISAAAKGWVKGYGNGAFYPLNKITRAEVVTLVNRMLEREFDENFDRTNMLILPDVPGHWAFNDILEAMNGHDFIRENGKEKWTKLR